MFKRTQILISLMLAVLVLSRYIHEEVSHEDSEARALQSLLHALEGRRLLEPRLTGGFDYATCTSSDPEALVPEPMCSDPPPPDDPKHAELLQAMRRIRATVREDPTHALRHAEALTYLLSQHNGAAEKGVELFEQAVHDFPNDPRLLCDLAAAYLLRAQELDQPLDLIHALSAVDRAIGRDESLREAHFNRALILSKLHLKASARQAWERYLALDPNSPWATDAKRFLADLAEPESAERWQSQRSRLAMAAWAADQHRVQELVFEFPQQSRALVGDELLAAWGRAFASGQIDEAERKLRAARAIATESSRIAGDRLLADAIAAIDVALAHGDQAQLKSLSNGHRLYREARLVHEQQHYTEASSLFHQALAAFEQAGTPFVAWPAYYLAIIAYHEPDYPRSLKALAELASRFGVAEYVALQAHIDWMMALNHGRLGSYAHALTHLERARQGFSKAREQENLAAINSLTARTLELVGDDRQSWDYRYKSLRALDELHKPRRAQNILQGAVDSLRRSGRTHAALYFQDELLHHTSPGESPLSKALALKTRSDLLRALNRLPEALADLQSASEAALEVTQEGLQQGLRADLLIVEGRLLRHTNPAASLAALHQALEQTRVKNNQHLLIEIHRECAETYLSQGNEARARDELEAGLNEVERQYQLLGNPALQLFYLEQSRQLFERMIELTLSIAEDTELAFGYAEQLKAWLWQSPTSQDGYPISNRAFKSALQTTAAIPEETALLEFLVLPDRLLLWVLHKDQVHLFSTETNRVELREQVVAYRHWLQQKKSTATTQASARLFKTLLGPALAMIQEVETLVIVPDGILHAVPFPALQHEPGGRYLVEDYALGIAPSASLYTELLGRHREFEDTPPTRALLVGDFEFAHEAFPHLPALSQSGEEINAIAALYEQPILLTGEEATRSNLLEQLPLSEVVHFSGHTVPVPARPENSNLLLAPDPRIPDLGVLHAHEIHLPQPPLARLVMLAACQTAAGELWQSTGMTSLARPFLDAGVPVVVGSLWNVRDAATAPLAIAFHKAYRNGKTPFQALREAQLGHIKNKDKTLNNPLAWAGFLAFGGSD